MYAYVVWGTVHLRHQQFFTIFDLYPQGQIYFHFRGYNILVQLLEFWTFVVELLLGILCKHNSSTGKKFYETSSIIDFLGEFYF